MNRLAIFPIIKVGDWAFRTTIADSFYILIYAFGPEDQFQLRHFTNEVDAKNYIDAVSSRIS